jgi:hypothetical protein
LEKKLRHPERRRAKAFLFGDILRAEVEGPTGFSQKIVEAESITPGKVITLALRSDIFSEATTLLDSPYRSLYL